MRLPGTTGPARPALTGRALGLGALVILLVVVLASPVHRYLQSRSDIGQASAQYHDDRRQEAQLSAQKARYGDPGFIEAQARARLQYAVPGDTTYVVVDKGAETRIEATRSGETRPGPSGPAWNTRLWNSVRAAGT